MILPRGKALNSFNQSEALPRVVTHHQYNISARFSDAISQRKLMVAVSQNVLCFLRLVVACVQTPPPLKNSLPIFSERRGVSVYRLANSPSVPLMDLGSAFCPHTSAVVSKLFRLSVKKRLKLMFLT